MKFTKATLQDLVYDYGDIEDYEQYTVISKDIVDTSRWSIVYKMIFQYGNRFFQTSYRKGATECQDESPYEYESDEIECKEVFPVEKTIVVYE